MRVRLIFFGAVALLSFVSAVKDASGVQNEAGEPIRVPDELKKIRGGDAPAAAPINSKPNEAGKVPDAAPVNAKPSEAGEAPGAAPINSKPNEAGEAPSAVPVNTKPNEANKAPGAAPASDTDKALEFTELFYVAGCQKKAMVKNYIIPLSIALKSHKDGLTFTLKDVIEPQLASYFEVKEADAKLSLSLKETIPKKLLDDISQLLFVLYVTNSATSTDILCHTTVVINLSNELFEPSFKDIVVGYPKRYDYVEVYAGPLVTSVAISVPKENVKDFNFQYVIKEKDCPFMVHKTTGKIYPVEYCPDLNDVQCTVVVQNLDVNGDKVIDEHELMLRVKLLESSQIVGLFLSNVISEDLDVLLTDIEAQTKVMFKSLSHTVMPHTNLEKEHVPLMRIYGYAFESEQGNVMDGQVIVEKLKSLPNLVKVTVVPKEGPPQPLPDNNYPLLIAVILLFIVTLLLGSSVFYILFVRNGCIRHGLPCLNSDTNATTPLELDMEGPSQTRWIHSSSQIDVFNACNQVDHIDNQILAADYQTPDAVILNRKNSAKNIPSSSFTTFKPNSHGNDYMSMGQSDRSSAEQTSRRNVPVLSVVSLPPITNDRTRNRNTHTVHRTEVRI